MFVYCAFDWRFVLLCVEFTIYMSAKIKLKYKTKLALHVKY